ncbi:MAG TPA: cation:proton antiporter [Gammaproteobacteria bacterium]|nr:cation:proton antiporter [Gammaproteobacteria bacterium]
MEPNHILFNLFLIFTGAALLSTLVLLTRQSLLVAYLLLGLLFGPFGLKLIPDRELARQIGDIGIIFLLFLLGVELNPRDLWQMFLKISWIAILSSIIFFIVGAGVAYIFGFTLEECVVVGAAMMFSSTIIGLKLLPSSTLHHQRVGEIMVGILLFQDLIAIAAMLVIHGMATPGGAYWLDFGMALITLPTLLLVAFSVERYVLRPMLSRFDTVQEYIFLVAIAWCLGMAKLAAHFGLSDEIGAFIAGVAIAEGPIASYITENLRPIRDFCLVMFFFTIGAGFNLQLLPEILVPAILLAAIFLIFKPYVFEFLLKRSGEVRHIAAEAGVRLGQASEFSLLLGVMAYQMVPDLIDAKTNYLIQAVTIITFIVSCYWVGSKYPTPMSFDKKLHKA